MAIDLIYLQLVNTTNTHESKLIFLTPFRFNHSKVDLEQILINQALELPSPLHLLIEKNKNV